MRPRAQDRAVVQERIESGVPMFHVVVDMSLSPFMSRKEISRVVDQLSRLYGLNMRCEDPAHLFLTGGAGDEARPRGAPLPPLPLVSATETLPTSPQPGPDDAAPASAAKAQPGASSAVDTVAHVSAQAVLSADVAHSVRKKNDFGLSV